MKIVRNSALAVLMTASVFAVAQNKPAAPAAGQQQPAQQQQLPLGKRPPQAQSKEEMNAYSAITKLTDPAGTEKAADDFAAKYPNSELRAAVYQRAMFNYQNTGNDDKALEMGRKSLTYFPDDPTVLVTVAEMIVQHTRETDLDRDERLAEATKDANHAIETVTDFPPPQGMPAEQVASIKNEIRQTAHAVLGTAGLIKKDYAAAEAEYRKALDITPPTADSAIALRLVLTLDRAGKYADALQMCDKTIEMAKDQPNILQLAQNERERLVKLAPKK